jgi:hypothetical protein
MVNTNCIYQRSPRFSRDDANVATEVDGLLAGGKIDSNHSTNRFWKGTNYQLIIGIGVALCVVFMVGSSLSLRELEMDALALPLLGSSRRDHHHAPSSHHHHPHHPSESHHHDSKGHHHHPHLDTHAHKHDRDQGHKHSHDEHEAHHKEHEEPETHHPRHERDTKAPKEHTTSHPRHERDTKAPKAHTTSHPRHERDTKAPKAEHKGRHNKMEKPEPDPCTELLTGVFIQECMSLDGTSVGTFVSGPSGDGVVGIGTSGRLLSKFVVGGGLPLESKRRLESAPEDDVSASSVDASEDEATSGDAPEDAASADSASADAVESEDGAKSGSRLVATRHKPSGHTRNRSGTPADGADETDNATNSADADSADAPEDASADNSVDAASGDSSDLAAEVTSADDTDEEDSKDTDDVDDDKCVRSATISSGPDWIEETGVAKYKVQAGRGRRKSSKVFWNFAGIGICTFQKLDGRHCRRALNDVLDAFKHDKTVDARAYSSRDLC